MKKLLYALLITVGFFVAAPALAMIGYQGENPTVPQKWEPASLEPASQKVQPVNTTKRFGHRGENPTSNKTKQQEARERKEAEQKEKQWMQKHKGVRAYSRLAQ